MSSDRVPPELEVLGFRGVLCRTGLTGLRREPAGVDRFDDLAARSSAFECVTRFCVNTLFGDSAEERLIWLFKTDLIYSLEKDGRHHRPRRRQHSRIYRGSQRGGAPRLLGGQGAPQGTILKGIQERQKKAKSRRLKTS